MAYPMEYCKICHKGESLSFNKSLDYYAKKKVKTTPCYKCNGVREVIMSDKVPKFGIFGA